MKHLLLLMAAAVIAIGTGCSTFENIAFGMASNGTVVKGETTGSTTSGSVAPNVLVGTIQNSIASAPALDQTKKTQVVLAYTESQSFLASLFGLTAITRTFTYIGNASESAEDTTARMNALAKVLTCNSQPPDSKTGSTSTTASSSATTSATDQK